MVGRSPPGTRARKRGVHILTFWRADDASWRWRPPFTMTDPATLIALPRGVASASSAWPSRACASKFVGPSAKVFLRSDGLRERYVVERELGRGGMATVF